VIGFPAHSAWQKAEKATAARDVPPGQPSVFRDYRTMAEVIAYSSGKWCGNARRFTTREEAEANVQDLRMRWFAVRETRVVESDDPVNYSYVHGRLESLRRQRHRRNKLQPR
jgi:hypothetical protein